MCAKFRDIFSIICLIWLLKEMFLTYSKYYLQGLFQVNRHLAMKMQFLEYLLSLLSCTILSLAEKETSGLGNYHRSTVNSKSQYKYSAVPFRPDINQEEEELNPAHGSYFLTFVTIRLQPAPNTAYYMHFLIHFGNKIVQSAPIVAQ